MLPKGTDGKGVGRYLALAQVGFEMVAPIALGIALDYYCGWSPWGAVVGTIVGFVGGLAHLVSLARRLEKQDADEKNAEPKTDPK
jgi:F0F1-type ATP synthase assembly protein I